MAPSVSDPVEGMPTAEPAHAKRRPNPRLLIPLGLLMVAVGGATAWYLGSRPQSDRLELSGRIEGYPTDIGAKVGGRINFVAVREGDRVRQGQVLVRLDDAELQAQFQKATARIAAAQQQVEQAQLQIDIATSQIQESKLEVQQASGDAQGRILQAEANVAASEAQLSQAEAQLNQVRSELQLAQTNRNRLAQLVNQGAIAQQQFDQAQTNLETAQATLRSREASVTAARRQVNAAQGSLAQAQTTSFNPDIRNTQLTASQRQLSIAKAQVTAAQAELKSAEADKKTVEAQLAYLTVSSPLSGIVITRSVEPGEVVATGRTLLTLLDPQQVYLRGYIPEGEIGKVRIGQPAQIFLDSAPDQALSATVSAVDTQASFTPENIYFREDRVKQVFGINLNITNPTGLAKPGMPADGEILLQSSEPAK